jgi:GntR family transcriptional regulator
MTGLDRTSPLPLWAQLTARLGERLHAGEFGAQFPTEAELMADYGVSRHTVREALRRLSEAGLLDRQRGRGSFVRDAAGPIEQSLGAIYSLAASIEREGLPEQSAVLCLETVRDAPAAVRLGLGPRAELVHVRRLRWAGGEPLAVDESWLPAAIGAPLLRVDLSHGSLYAHLRERCGIETTGGEERIHAAVAGDADRELLQLPPGEAVFVVERIARSGDRPVEWRRSTIRGDRFSFAADWPGERGPAAGGPAGGDTGGPPSS